MYAVTIAMRATSAEAASQLKQASKDVVAPSLAEPGCLFFDALFDDADPLLVDDFEGFHRFAYQQGAVELTALELAAARRVGIGERPQGVVYAALYLGESSSGNVAVVRVAVQRRPQREAAPQRLGPPVQDARVQATRVGQPELLEILARENMRQLAQRITARFHLNPLSRNELKAYIGHRLAVAGPLHGVGFVKVRNRKPAGKPQPELVVFGNLDVFTEPAVSQEEFAANHRG